MKRIILTSLALLAVCALPFLASAGMRSRAVPVTAVGTTIATNQIQIIGGVEGVHCDIAGSATGTVTLSYMGNTFMTTAALTADAFYCPMVQNVQSDTSESITNQYSYMPCAGLVTVTVKDDAAVITNIHTITIISRD